MIGGGEVMWNAQPMTPKCKFGQKRGRGHHVGACGRNAVYALLFAGASFDGDDNGGKRVSASVKCWKCQKMGHYANKCPL